MELMCPDTDVRNTASILWNNLSEDMKKHMPWDDNRFNNMLDTIKEPELLNLINTLGSMFNVQYVRNCTIMEEWRTNIYIPIVIWIQTHTQTNYIL